MIRFDSDKEMNEYEYGKVLLIIINYQAIWYYAMVRFRTIDLKSHPIAQFEENCIIRKKTTKFKKSKQQILTLIKHFPNLDVIYGDFPLKKALQDIWNLWWRYLGSHFDFRDKQCGQRCNGVM